MDHKTYLKTYIVQETDLNENVARIEIMLPDQTVSWETRMPILRILVNGQIEFSCTGDGVHRFLEDLSDIAAIASWS